MNELLKKPLQKALTAFFNLVHPLLNTKLVLFSRFYAKHTADYVLKRGHISKCDYVLSLSDEAVARRIFIGLDDEHLKAKKTVEWIRQIKAIQCDTIFDIGANLGHVSIPLLVEGVLSRAYMWEPDPANFRLLSANIILNNVVERTKAFNCALSDADHSLTMELSTNNFGDHRIRMSNSPGTYDEHLRKTIAVAGRKLDGFVDQNLEISKVLIWMDAQGYEGKVLAGAKEILNQRPPIVIELWPYGLERSGGIGQLLDLLHQYNSYYDLSLQVPRADPVMTLKNVYESNKHDDAFITDILLV